MEGDVINGTVMAGQIAGLINKEQTCKEDVYKRQGVPCVYFVRGKGDRQKNDCQRLCSYAVVRKKRRRALSGMPQL